MTDDDNTPYQRRTTVLRRDRRYLGWLVLVAIFFTVGGWVLFTETSRLRQGLNLFAATLFAIGGVILAIVLLVGGRAAMKVADDGVHDLSRPWRHELVPWEQLTAITPWAGSPVGEWVTLRVEQPSGESAEVHVHADLIVGGAKAVVVAITNHPRFADSPARGDARSHELGGS